MFFNKNLQQVIDDMIGPSYETIWGWRPIGYVVKHDCIEVDLPGVKKESVEVSLHPTEKQVVVAWKDRQGKEQRRVFVLSSNCVGVSASMEDGLLVIQLILSKPEAKKIEVK